jgi:hypothetical protein
MFTGAQGKASSATSQYLDNVVTTVDNGETTGDVSGNYINIRLAAFPGAGVYTDLSFATIFAEAGYNISLHNIVDESARYSNEQTVGSIFNVSDNIRFENLFFNIGILYTINKMETGRRGKSRLSGKAIGCPPPKKKR